MPINWKDASTQERLLVAILAASDNKLDYGKIAAYFGQGATYASMEHKFRSAKKAADALRNEALREGRISSNGGLATSPAKKKGPDAVRSGRVEKKGKAKGNGKQKGKSKADADDYEPLGGATIGKEEENVTVEKEVNSTLEKEENVIVKKEELDRHLDGLELEGWM